MPLSKEQIEAREATKPDKMAIGIAGGFQLDSKDYHMATDEVDALPATQLPRCTSAHVASALQRRNTAIKRMRPSLPQALVLMPARLRIPLPCPALPELVVGCIAAVQQHVSATHQACLVSVR